MSSRFTADILIAAYERLILDHARGDLVDLGCGAQPYREMYRYVVNSITAIDWDNSPHDGEVDVRCDIGRRIDLPDDSADTILCTDVLEHVFDPRTVWSEMARVLRPVGHVIVGVPFMYWIHEAPHDYHRYTRFALERYATEAGFDVVSLESVGGLSCVLADLLCKAAPPRLKAVTDRVVRVFAEPSTKETVFPLAYLLVAKRRR